jgi:hypothetical protein
MKCDHTCSVCGTHEQGDWIEDRANMLQTHQLCFSCSHWFDLSKAYNGKYPAVIVDHVHYLVLPDPPKNYGGFVGFGGAKFVIKLNDGREVTTHNLWCQGDIPELWRTKLPDNAVFLRESDI